MILEKLRELIRENDTKDKVIVVGLSDYLDTWNAVLEEAKTFIPEPVHLTKGYMGIDVDGVPVVQIDDLEGTLPCLKYKEAVLKYLENQSNLKELVS